MPRRPRIESKLRNHHGITSDKGVPNEKGRSLKRPFQDDIDDADIGPESGESDGISENESEDLDAPRVAQWVDEDELVEDEEDMREGSSNLKNLQNDLSGLPLGALRKAQRMLARTEVGSEGSESDDGEDQELETHSIVSKGKEGKGKERESVEWSLKPKKEIAKRSNKHAPIEVTSKRPVTRKRTVVEVKTIQAQDPRFLPLAGEFSATKFQHAYKFLAGSHETELNTLQENLKRARKLLSSSPRDTYEERANEVSRLERAVKRAESLVNKDRRDKVEQEALAKIKKEEQEKRKQGKGEWHMKTSNKRELLMKARYEALSAEGGKRAVKKAIEKKQKKTAQKEKRSRPFVKEGMKRRRVV